MSSREQNVTVDSAARVRRLQEKKAKRNKPAPPPAVCAAPATVKQGPYERLLQRIDADNANLRQKSPQEPQNAPPAANVC